MTTKCTKKLFDPENTGDPESTKIIAERLKDGTLKKAIGGVFKTRRPPKKFRTKRLSGEKVDEHEGALICLGTDGLNATEGYGGMGAIDASCIDIMVGPMSSVADKIPAGSTVGRSFRADAARIYISQLTDIDDNFGLAQGVGQDRKARSGIGIKADGVRIVGREGVKIVTGPAQGSTGFPDGAEPNSQGGKLLPAGGKIELIAGNFTEPQELPVPFKGGRLSGGAGTVKVETLQPVLLGDNTKEAIEELSKIVGQIWSALNVFAMIYAPETAISGVSYLEPWRPAAAATATTYSMSNVISTLHHVNNNRLVWQINHLGIEGSPLKPTKYICSSNVYTT